MHNDMFALKGGYEIVFWKGSRVRECGGESSLCT